MTYIVVFDTNILISALISPSGSPFLCVALARDRRIQSVTCKEILDEFAEKLILKFTLSEERTEEIIEEIRQCSRIVSINQQLAVVSADPDDDMIIECAIAGNATHIITGDKHLLSLVQYQNIQIVKAIDFLNLFRGEV